MLSRKRNVAPGISHTVDVIIVTLVPGINNGQSDKSGGQNDFPRAIPPKTLEYTIARAFAIKPRHTNVVTSRNNFNSIFKVQFSGGSGGEENLNSACDVVSAS